MSGGKMIAGLGALAAASVMSKPDPPLAPKNYGSLLNYYLAVLDEIKDGVPRDYPGFIPIDRMYKSFDAEVWQYGLPVSWGTLADYHGTFIKTEKERYLKWRCQKDGMSYDQSLIDDDILIKPRMNEGVYTGDARLFIPDYLEPEPEEKEEKKVELHNPELWEALHPSKPEEPEEPKEITMWDVIKSELYDHPMIGTFVCIGAGLFGLYMIAIFASFISILS